MHAIARNRVGEIEVADNLTLGDLGAALAAGWRDFRNAPQYGLFFAGIFVAAGLVMTLYLLNRGEVAWLIGAAAGFPLLAPFAAAGLYEVSRRRDKGETIGWRPVLGAINSGDGQLPVMGVLVFITFAFWIILAHAVFGVFLGQSGLGPKPLELLFSPTGLGMLGVGSIIGAIIALFLFSITVVSLPMLTDRKVDFITAIVVSVRVVQLNTLVMLSWAVIIALLAFAAMVPAFLGLLIVLPVLGHATFHLYRRAVG